MVAVKTVAAVETIIAVKIITDIKIVAAIEKRVFIADITKTFYKKLKK